MFEVLGTLAFTVLAALMLFMSGLVAPWEQGLPIQLVAFALLYLSMRRLARTRAWVWLVLPFAAIGLWLVIITLGSELLGWTA